MIEATIDIDNSEEEKLDLGVSDEALEAAAAALPRADKMTTYSVVSPFCV